MSDKSQNLQLQDQEAELQSQAVPSVRTVRVDSRHMSRSILLGEHTHQCIDGTKVHIWERSGSYLARGSFGGERFAKTLGADVRDASIALRQLLVDIDDGRFQRSSDMTKQRFPKKNLQRLSVRDLFNKFLEEKRRLRGEDTEKKYKDRLARPLDFAESCVNSRKYPFVIDIDREWGLQLREFLFDAKTTRNGRANGDQHPLSQKQIRNILETLRNVFHWAQSAEVRLLSSDWCNPITTDFIGPEAQKDPLRKDPLPIADRIKLIASMGLSELCFLAISMVLPFRAGEVSGLLISDVDLDAREFKFGTRFEGADFTKGKTSFTVPFPAELLPIVRHVIGSRQEGPLLLGKRFVGKSPRYVPANHQALEVEFKSYLNQLPNKAVTCENDRKREFRRFLRSHCGGICPGLLNKTFKLVCHKIGLEGICLRTMRSAVSNSMKRAGINHLEMTYLTGHTTNDILNEYVSLDPHGEMAKYFATIQPLLIAIQEQASKLGIGERWNQEDGQLELAG